MDPLDQRKTKLAMLYLASKVGWQIDVFKLIRMLSLADDLHEVKWGDPLRERECFDIESNTLLAALDKGGDCLIDPRLFIKDEHRDTLTVDMITYEMSGSETEALDTAYKYLTEGYGYEDIPS